MARNYKLRNERLSINVTPEIKRALEQLSTNYTEKAHESFSQAKIARDALHEYLALRGFMPPTPELRKTIDMFLSVENQ